MANQRKSPITLIAGEALAAFRRVKMHTTAGQVVYADAADGDNWFAVTLDSADSGDGVALQLRDSIESMVITAAGAITKGAALYPADDGKCDDAITDAPFGTALTATAGNAEFVEALPFAGAQMFLLSVSATASGNTAIPKPSVPLLICDWWIISRTTGAANAKLVNGSTDASAVVAKGATNDAIVRGGTLVAAQDEVAAATALNANLSAAEATDFFVLCKRKG